METETFTSDGVVEDTRRGLQDEPKWLSSLYFYDERGSELFEAICKTPEYYPTRTEEAILAERAHEVLDLAGQELVVAELGSGSSRKTRTILRALLERDGRGTYLPVDVSESFLHGVAADLRSRFPKLDVRPIAAEYSEGLARIGSTPAAGRLVLFLGSSIGNFEPPEQVGLLRVAHDALSPGDAFLLGTDLVKDPQVLEAAYNDAQGVTARFNLNILRHLNRRLDGEVDLGGFAHEAFWNPEASRMEMHLRSLRDQRIVFPGADLDVPVMKDELIHTENSYKFTMESAADLADQAGLRVERTWQDFNGWFAVHLLRKVE